MKESLLWMNLNGAVGMAREKGTIEFYKYNLKEIIQSITKEEQKSDTVMVKYREDEVANIMSNSTKSIFKPLIKDGCIVIVR